LLAVSTLMIPFTVTVIPQYFVYLKLHWINTFAPLIIPAFLGVGGSTLFIFLMRQFFLGIPVELEEAAYLDGCSPFKAFRRVILPLCKPAIFTVVIFQFVFSWNDFFGPLVFLNSSSLFTLPLGRPRDGILPGPGPRRGGRVGTRRTRRHRHRTRGAGLRPR
jgi:multiple sugar transport system permease protein